MTPRPLRTKGHLTLLQGGLGEQEIPQPRQESRMVRGAVKEAEESGDPQGDREYRTRLMDHYLFSESPRLLLETWPTDLLEYFVSQANAHEAAGVRVDPLQFTEWAFHLPEGVDLSPDPDQS